MKTANEIVVTGLSLQTALGESCSDNWKRMMAGESAIALRQPFLDLEPGPLAMAGKQPIDLKTLAQTLALAAWKDAGLANEPAGNDCGVVVGSSRSHLQALEQMNRGRTRSSGTLSGAVEGDWFAALAHNPALTVSRSVGAGGPLLAPMAACATGMWAITQATDLLRQGQCSRVIAGAVESPITRLTLAGFRKMGALASTGCYPFDLAREGFVLGEGGALMVLETLATARARGAKIYAKVLGTGITNDSHHVSAFDPSYKMGKRAVQLCLERSQWTADSVDAVHVHGTSTQQNDQMEASLIRQLLRPNVWVMASKGATGHTLGASGAVTIALGLLSLQQQAILPCVGLQQAAFDLNFARAGRSVPLQNLLCFSFGFGGQNAVLALQVV